MTTTNNGQPMPRHNEPGALSLLEFYAPHMESFLKDPEIADNLFDSGTQSHAEKQAAFRTLLQEAEQTLGLIEEYLSKDSILLEIGGGVGLTYGYLKHLGYEITSIEPSFRGFGNRYRAGQKILAMMNLSQDGWLNYSTAELGRIDSKFDLIFSHFVIEHIPEIDQAFEKMLERLKPGGVLRHICPNYAFPFEPHYNILLVPFFPKLTEKFKQNLQSEPVWRDLNFLTYSRIRKIARKHRLAVSFDKNLPYLFLKRFDEDPRFKARKASLYACYRLMKLTGLLNLAKLFPTSLASPMRFTMRPES